jgi:site-specific recombinase XerD
MVHRRFSQAGVNNPHKGSHISRHAFAMRLLQHGQSLKAIADILGHRNINTTFIYTKADLQALRQVTLEWPEV